MKKMDNNLSVRRMVRSDLAKVMEIEGASFPVPWKESFFMRELVLPVSHFFVAVSDGIVVGYIGFWIVEDEAQIVNLAVHPDYRRQGIAVRLLDYIFSFLSGSGVKNMHLDVREGNIPAVNLYTSLGFEKIGIRKGYYKHNNENAIEMSLIL